MGTKLHPGLLHRRVGNRIKHFRKLQNKTQEELAFAIDVTAQYLGYLERGQRNTTVDKIDKIAKALNIEPAELFR